MSREVELLAGPAGVLHRGVRDPGTTSLQRRVALAVEGFCPRCVFSELQLGGFCVLCHAQWKAKRQYVEGLGWHVQLTERNEHGDEVTQIGWRYVDDGRRLVAEAWECPPLVTDIPL